MVSRRKHDPGDAASSPGLLTAEQEIALAEMIAAGGEAAERARAQFLLANQRLVHEVAKRYRGCGLDYEDLVQEGNIGLLRAIEKFDPARGFKFSTMAWWWIKQAITREILNTGRTIRLPVHFQEALRRMNKVEVRLAAELDRLPTDEELASSTGFTVTRIQELRGIPWTVSLDEPLGDADELAREDAIADPQASIEERVTNDLFAEQLDQILQQILKPREYEVIKKRFRLRDQPQEQGLAQIGRDLGISRERVRQIEARALWKLRQSPQVVALSL